MRLRTVLERIVATTLRFPAAVALGLALLALAGGALAVLKLSPSADTDTLVNKSSPTFKATEAYHRQFGDDAVYILIRGALTNLVDTSDLNRLIGLEGCLSGNVPAGRSPLGGVNGPCGRLARTKPVRVVYGPGTFLNEAVGEIQQQFATQTQAASAQEAGAREAARKLAASKGASKAEQAKVANEAGQLVQAQFYKTALTLALKYGLRRLPQLNDPSFVNTIVFAPELGAGVPKPRFAYLFPTKNSALVQVRLRADLSDSQRRGAITQIRQATALPRFALQHGQRYVVTGVPVVVSDLTRSISHSIVSLLLGALLVMAAMLALVFRSRLRMLPLIVALAAAGLVFGAMALAGISLTMASIAALPILIGLGVDYAIQLQSRYDEALRDGSRGARAAALEAVRRGGPAIATAGLATAAGFVVLQLSPVPMVRGFGVVLVVGILVAFLAALTGGFATLVLADRARPRSNRGVLGSIGAAARGAGELLDGTGAACARWLRDGPPGRVLVPSGRAFGGAWRAALALSVRRPGRVLAIGVALAVLGLAADTQTSVVSDIQKLVPQQSAAIQNLTSLQKSTGIAGEIDVTVEADDLTDPSVLRWMADYQKTVLTKLGYDSKGRGCGNARLCPALSLPDLFRSDTNGLSQARIRGLLDAVPAYFSQAVITADRKVATLAFGIKLMSLSEQKDVIDTMRRELDPPPGIRAQLAGLTVLAAEANGAISAQWRRFTTLLAGLLAVGALLLLVFRRVQRALVPLVPIALASGWSALVLFCIRIPLNPMSVTLGALVIAISTEFSVLLSERYREEREAGHTRTDALERTYRSTGRAVLASGLTAIAGFAVLTISDIRMLRDFGAVTVVDLAVSILGVLIVLPAVLMLAERGEFSALPARAARRLRRLRRPSSARSTA